MKIKKIYMIFDENKKIKNNYFTTGGLAQCNQNGCICVANLVDTLKELIKSHDEIEQNIDDLLTNWNKTENAKEKYKDYGIKESNLYKSYHDLINTILTTDEIDNIQEDINYNFMSELFTNKMVEKLESKEV